MKQNEYLPPCDTMAQILSYQYLHKESCAVLKSPKGNSLQFSSFRTFAALE